MAADPIDPLPPAPAPPAPDPEPTRARQVTCEFCECKLSQHGEVLRRGAAAKRYSQIEEEVERLTRDLANMTRDLETAKRELAEAKATATRRPLIPL